MILGIPSSSIGPPFYPILLGTLTISMVIFHSYVKLPKDISMIGTAQSHSVCIYICGMIWLHSVLYPNVVSNRTLLVLGELKVTNNLDDIPFNYHFPMIFLWFWWENSLFWHHPKGKCFSFHPQQGTFQPAPRAPQRVAPWCAPPRSAPRRRSARGRACLENCHEISRSRNSQWLGNK